jgi:hypothetical protein
MVSICIIDQDHLARISQLPSLSGHPRMIQILGTSHRPTVTGLKFVMPLPKYNRFGHRTDKEPIEHRMTAERRQMARTGPAIVEFFVTVFKIFDQGGPARVENVITVKPTSLLCFPVDLQAMAAVRNTELHDFILSLNLSDSDFEKCKEIFEREMVSHSQLLDGSVTIEDLREVGCPEPVLASIPVAIEREKEEEAKRRVQVSDFVELLLHSLHFFFAAVCQTFTCILRHAH